MTTVLGLFAKYWEPGKAKTRLAASLGQVQAADIARHFYDCSLARFAGLGDRQVVAFTPPERRPQFEAYPHGYWELTEQSGGSLGERMAQFFDEQFARGHYKVVLVGSDSPDLPLSYLQEAFDALDKVPVVLGPSDDGGYYLVGSASKTPPIFHKVPWSTSAVWQKTLALLEQAKIPMVALPSWADVDDLESLHQLRARLASSAAPLDRALQTLQAQIDLLPAISKSN